MVARGRAACPLTVSAPGVNDLPHAAAANARRIVSRARESFLMSSWQLEPELRFDETPRQRIPCDVDRLHVEDVVGFDGEFQPRRKASRESGVVKIAPGYPQQVRIDARPSHGGRGRVDEIGPHVAELVEGTAPSFRQRRAGRHLMARPSGQIVSAAERVAEIPGDLPCLLYTSPS